MEDFDLKNPIHRKTLACFLKEKLLEQRLNEENLVAISGVSLPTVRRYLHVGNSDTAPEGGSHQSYLELLNALKTDHASFRSYMNTRLQAASDRSDLVNGDQGMNLGGITIEAGANLYQSPIGAQTVNYSTIQNK